MRRLGNWLRSLIAGTIISAGVTMSPLLFWVEIPVSRDAWGVAWAPIKLTADDPLWLPFVVVAVLATILVHTLKLPYR